MMRIAIQTHQKGPALSIPGAAIPKSLWRMPYVLSPSKSRLKPGHQEPEVAPRQMTDGRNVIQDYSDAGLTLRQHPIAFLRKDLQEHNSSEMMNARDGW